MQDKDDSKFEESTAAGSSTSEDRIGTSTVAKNHENMSADESPTNNSNTNMEYDDKHRHSRALRILELHGRGYAQKEIARTLDISQLTVIKELDRIKSSIYDEPDAYAQAYCDQERSVAGLKVVGKELMRIAKDIQLPAELRIKALSLLLQTSVKSCNVQKIGVMLHNG